jgi:antagonist of KipI
MLEIVRAGQQTTVQDGGRNGWRHIGVGSAGALDLHSMQVANLLAGNDRGAAVVEFMLTGAWLRFHRAVRIALTGAPIDALCGDVAIAQMRPVDLPAGAELRLGSNRFGACSYLAIDGGIAMPPILGSAATDLRGGFGGLNGRVLRAGDQLPLGASKHPACDQIQVAPWWIDVQPDVILDQAPVVHVLPATDACTPASGLFDATWSVSTRSNRQGLRLAGPALQLADTRERISAPVVAGSVQLPPDGNPIVLLADAQTTGGYACIGVVASADLPRLGQCRPGDAVRFVRVDLAAALRRERERRARLERIAYAISLRQPR